MSLIVGSIRFSFHVFWTLYCPKSAPLCDLEFLLCFEITFVNELVLQRYINYSYVLLLSDVRPSHLTN